MYFRSELSVHPFDFDRVHAFLEYWGLINYGLTIMNIHKPSRLVQPYTDAHNMTLTEDTVGDIQPAEPLRKSHKHGTGAHMLDLLSDSDDLDDDRSLMSPSSANISAAKLTDAEGMTI